MKPILLDLFCGAGGASKGYSDVGFNIIGVDVNPQPNYPFEFHQTDWKYGLHYLTQHYKISAIHASPPCQHYSVMTKKWGERQVKKHPNLINEVRTELNKLEIPYVIENVQGSPLINPITLCGSMFSLRKKEAYLKRHRLFEFSSGKPDIKIPSCNHKGKAIGVYGHAGGSSKRDGIKFNSTDDWRKIMEIPWMTGKELAEAIPPAYTRFVGTFLLNEIK